MVMVVVVMGMVVGMEGGGRGGEVETPDCYYTVHSLTAQRVSNWANEYEWRVYSKCSK